MKISAILVVASLASASAFVPAAKCTPKSTSLNVVTKGKIGPVRKAISSITKENFSSTLDEIEPFLTTEAGMSIYIKSMKRVKAKAAALGVEVPASYAKDAKCTQKRREKQSAYCTAKTEEAAAAAAEAAEADAAAAAEAAEAKAAEAKAEESTEEETPAAE